MSLRAFRHVSYIIRYNFYLYYISIIFLFIKYIPFPLLHIGVLGISSQKYELLLTTMQQICKFCPNFLHILTNGVKLVTNGGVKGWKGEEAKGWRGEGAKGRRDSPLRYQWPTTLKRRVGWRSAAASPPHSFTLFYRRAESFRTQRGISWLSLCCPFSSLVTQWNEEFKCTPKKATFQIQNSLLGTN